MKKSLFFFLFCSLFSFGVQAQLTDGTIAPNFTVTDLDGNTHTLYEYLGEGKTVILQLSASWSSPDWNYTQAGILEYMHTTYGPNGSDEVVVLFAEADSATNDDCLYDLPTCGNQSSVGNWVEAISYPMIGGEDGASLAVSYAIAYYPTIYMIYPNQTIIEAGQVEIPVMEELLLDAPAGLEGPDNVAILASAQNDFFCEELSPTYQFQNLGTNTLTSFEAVLSANGVPTQTISWTGTLFSYEISTLSFDAISVVGEIDLSVSVSLPNGNTDSDPSNNEFSSIGYVPFFTLGSDFTISITPDNWPQEITIQITDPSGVIVYELMGDSLVQGEMTVIDLNDLNLLTPGCHEIHILDTFGDGLTNTGGIEIVNNGMVIYDDPDYENGVTIPFYNQFEYDHGATVIAFLDENGNGIFDEGEQPLLNQSFSIDPSNQLSFTNLDGFTTFILDGNSSYTLNWEEDLLWNINGDASVSFETGSDESEQTFYFAFTPSTDITLHDIDISSAITRCNWDVNYWLTYSNTGTTVNDGFVQLIPDELTTFITSSPAPDSTAGDTLYWFYENLLPSYSNQIVLQFGMPSVDFIDESIDFETNIETWEGAGSRKAILSSELVCSYDPNDKLVFPNGYGGEEKNYTLFNDSLEYTVRFQNTGNDTAFTVLISDAIDVNLDISTLRVISSSHDVETTVNTGTRIATFLFNDIYLADSFVNEPASHGFVKYGILPNQGLNEETEINNTANIFFDQNPPIITNTITNTMVSELPELAFIAASPLELDFGSIEIGEMGSETLIVQNPGELPLEVTQIISESPAFSTQTNGFIIAGGDEVILNVDFSPTEEITYISNLILNSNAGELIVAVKGEGGTNTGINDLDWRLSVAPNPSNGIFELNWQDENTLQNAVLNIFDVSGKTIISQKMNGNKENIDLSSQAKGVYFLSLETQNTTIIKKLIVN